MHSMKIELKESNSKESKIIKDRVRNLALSCGIEKIDGLYFFGNDDILDFEKFALFMIKLIEDKEFLNNCSLWHWDEEEDGEHYVDDVLMEVLERERLLANSML